MLRLQARMPRSAENSAIAKYASGIGAEVLPDRSIGPNAFPMPPPDLTTIARQLSTSINRYRVSIDSNVADRPCARLKISVWLI